MHLSLWRAVFAFSFCLATAALRIEDSDARVAYFPPPFAHSECEHTTLDAACRGFWWKEGDAANSLHYASGGAATSLSLAFNGSAISLFGWRSKIAGAAYIAVDDAPGIFVNFTARGTDADGVSALVFYRSSLDPAAAHVLRLEYADGSERGDGIIGIDYFEIEDAADESPINSEQNPNAALDASPSFPAFVTAAPLAIGIIALAVSLLLVAYCWFSRRRIRVRTRAPVEGRPSMSIDVPLGAFPSAAAYDAPAVWARKYFAPPDAPLSPRASSPGTPVDERRAFPALSQIAGAIDVPPGRPGRVPLRVYNPDRSLASATEESHALR